MNSMNNWQSEFQYLMHRKILSRDELSELLGQIKSVIDRETYLLKQEIEKYQTNTGWTGVIELGKQLLVYQQNREKSEALTIQAMADKHCKEMEEIIRQRNIEQGGWEEVKRWQDNWVKFIEWWNIFKGGIITLTKEEIINLIELRLVNLARLHKQ